MSAPTPKRIRYAFIEGRGFVAECLTTGVTSYAYLGSVHAKIARVSPDNVARHIIQEETEFDRGNRALLNAAGDAVKIIDAEAV